MVLLSNLNPHNRDKNDNFFDGLCDGFKINRCPAKFM